MADPALLRDLEALWEDEILPVFDAMNEGPAARAYVAEVRDRFANPFLAHRLADVEDDLAEHVGGALDDLHVRGHDEGQTEVLEDLALLGHSSQVLVVLVVPRLHA